MKITLQMALIPEILSVYNSGPGSKKSLKGTKKGPLFSKKGTKKGPHFVKKGTF